jgi:prepilin-type processing-associated H-X9-DG protein
VELLVVIAIIGILVALLLPAVQSARESARRTQCQNNLKQIGLAFHNHEGSLKFFPTGGWDWNTPPTYISGQPATGREQQAGWGFQILPYLEGVNAWSGSSAGTDLDRILQVIGSPNKNYFCPTRRKPQVVTFSHPQYLGGVEAKRALCDYAASNLESTGVVQRQVPIRMAEITDGTSNTLMVAEKRLNIMKLGKPNSDDILGYTTGFDAEVVRRSDRAPRQDYREDEDESVARFGASHPGKFNTVFADGSVRTLTYGIDRAIFAKVGEKSDGETVDLDTL